MKGSEKRTFAIALGTLLMTSCMPTEYSVTHDEHAKEVEQALNHAYGEKARGNGNQSTWGNGARMLFADAKAVQVGDLITILVNESASAKRSLDMNKSKSSSRKLELNSVWGLQNVLGPGMAPRVFAVNPALAPKDANPSNTWDTKSAQDFKGAGSTSNSDSLKASITAVVTHVYPNGNMKIVGRREVVINQQPQELEFSGIVRPQDISPDNTVPSAKVAQVKIKYGSGGELAAVAHEGWASRFLDFVWPF